METTIDVETNDGDRIQETPIEEFNSFSSLKETANPVVYKLVRVEGDGRLVPATDDEIMEVEDLLEDDNSELHFLEQSRDARCISSGGSMSSEANFECSEDVQGLSQSATTEDKARKLNARLEYIEEMLQKVKQEEKLRLSCKFPDNSSKYTSIDLPSDRHDRLSGSNHRPHADNSLQETISLVSPRLNDGGTQLQRVEAYQKPVEETIVGVSLGSDILTSSNTKADFSIIKGEVCLDNLSIRELQETFKSIFLRETSVKDKLWLKRQIVAGWCNASDASTTNIIINEKHVARKKVKKEMGPRIRRSKCVVGSPSTHQIIGVADDSCRGLSVNHINSMEGVQLVLSSKRLRIPKIECDAKSEDFCTEQSATKRVRKPTRRYIEELSEVETQDWGGRLASSAKNSVHGQSFLRSQIRPAPDVNSVEAAFVTRQESFGGSGVQVPYVSRMRRGRPRKNFMALMKFHPSGMAAKLVKKALGIRVSRQDGEIGSRILKARALPKRTARPSTAKNIEDERATVTSVNHSQQNLGSEHLDSSGDTSNDSIAVVPTSKGGTRRKPHRPWTLCEVMKLVEGVSRYGAGRWSEIKRVAFASYPYRTSVDLKDKWRNLLRASFSQAPTAKEARSSRKHPSSMPIPTPILARVKELAKMHCQVGHEQHLSKFAGPPRSIHETRSGFL